MNEGDRLKLRPLLVWWSDGRGYDLATALADEHAYLLPKRITNAQLSGLNSVVQAASHLGEVRAFAQHQAQRAARAARLDVEGYWRALQQALDKLESEASSLAAQGEIVPPAQPPKGKSSPKPPDWLALWLAQEFLQHLVAHSLYLGAASKARGNEKPRR